MPDGAAFDFKRPDYVAVFRQRAERLARIRRGEVNLQLLKAYYRDHIPQFISDWGVTYDPRNVEVGLPAIVPFILYPRQVEWCEWVIERWRARESGLCDKSREMGVSWLAVALSDSLCLFFEDVSIGFGSRKEEYVDKLGDPKSLFFKARMFLETLPVEFRGGWDRDKHSPHMRIMFPETGSTIGGEGGDNIGRGDRRSIYIIDESAHLEHPEQVDAALAMTTNCRIDVSSVNGLANPFAQKRQSLPARQVFTFHWRDDPRKDQAWYDRKVAELNNPVVVAQEIDIDYSASVEGVLIPSAWVQAAIDADKVLGFEVTGKRRGALDIADEGPDLVAFVSAHGVRLIDAEEWSGKNGDTFASVEKAFLLADQNELEDFSFDSDGMGALVRGDARVINERRAKQGERKIAVHAFRGSEAVADPEGSVIPGRKNKDYFYNAKAQAWWSLRVRFLRTYRWVKEGIKCSYDDIIVIPGDMKNRTKLTMELSQPTYQMNTQGKMVVDKKPEGTKSPNLADDVMMLFAPRKRIVDVTAVLAQSRRLG